MVVTVAVAADGNAVQVIDLETGRPTSTLKGHGSLVDGGGAQSRWFARGDVRGRQRPDAAGLGPRGRAPRRGNGSCPAT